MDNAGGGEPDTSDTIDVLKCLRCGQEGCTNVPGLGYQGEGPTMCTEHASPAMIQIVHLRCEHGDCTARRTFGFDGASARLCAVHKLDSMVDLMKRRSQVRERETSTDVHICATHTHLSIFFWPFFFACC